MLSPLSDVLANITLAHCDAVGRGHPLHQLSVQINTNGTRSRYPVDDVTSSDKRAHAPIHQSQEVFLGNRNCFDPFNIHRAPIFRRVSHNFLSHSKSRAPCGIRRLEEHIQHIQVRPSFLSRLRSRISVKYEGLSFRQNGYSQSRQRFAPASCS